MSRKIGETSGTPFRLRLTSRLIWFTKADRFRNGRSYGHYQNVCVIDLDGTYLSGQIPTKAAPWPLLRRCDEATRDRIPMNVAQLIDAVLLRQHIKVIKLNLPEGTRNGARYIRKWCPGSRRF